MLSQSKLIKPSSSKEIADGENKNLIKVKNLELSSKEHTVYKVSDDKMKYKIKESQIKNVLVLGESRSGKTQFLFNLMYPGTIEPEKEAIAQTPEPINCSMTIEIDNVELTISFIDTPGFDEQSKNPRPNEAIIQLIYDNVRQMINKIDLIIYVTKNIDTLLIDKLNFAMNKFPDYIDDFCLLLTNCDGKDQNYYNKMIDNFNELSKNSPHLKQKIANKMFFSGCILNNFKNLTTELNKWTMNQIENNIKIIKHIEGSNGKLFSQITSPGLNVARSIESTYRICLGLQDENEKNFKALMSTINSIIFKTTNEGMIKEIIDDQKKTTYEVQIPGDFLEKQSKEVQSEINRVPKMLEVLKGYQKTLVEERPKGLSYEELKNKISLLNLEIKEIEKQKTELFRYSELLKPFESKLKIADYVAETFRTTAISYSNDQQKRSPVKASINNNEEKPEF